MNIRGILGLAMAAIALTVLSPADAIAQDSYVPTPVTVSKEKVKVGGKLCWSHVVLERQTLYSISKAYGVSVEDIYKYNPSVRTEGLKKNAIILIPVVEDETATKPAKGRESAKAEKKADRQESARPTKTTKAEEMSATEGNAEMTLQKEKNNPKKEQTVHTVRWYETIETIAEKYGVSVEAIMRANRLSGKELKSRQKLVIPSRDAAAETVRETEAARQGSAESPTQESRKSPDYGVDSAAETKVKAEDEFSADEPQAALSAGSETGVRKENSVNFALVLPFMAGTEKPSSSSFDFYCGALLAARELGLDSLSVNISVFDTGTDALTRRSFDSEDFIIGPLSPADIRKVHDAAGDDVAIISPLDPKAAALTGEFPKLVQVPTPHDLQYADLVQWIADETQSGDRTVLISEKGGKESEAMKVFTEILDISGLKYKDLQYSLLEGRDIIAKLKSITVESPKTNRFIIASESEAFVNDVFRNISLLSRENRKVEVFCHSRVRGYDIEVESLHNNDLHISLAYYIDYNTPETISFVKAYRALFNTEPTQFSFQGYDVTKYFCELRAAYGDDWLKAIGHCPKTGLQTSFNFRDGSRINEGVRRIEYRPNYRIVSVE